MERGILFIIAIALVFGVGIMGSKRKIGFGWAFVKIQEENLTHSLLIKHNDSKTE